METVINTPSLDAVDQAACSPKRRRGRPPGSRNAPAEHRVVGTSRETEWDYGPVSAPVFVTGLRRPPRELALRNVPSVAGSRLLLGEVREGGLLISHTFQSAGNVPTWRLDGVPWRAGVTYGWRLETSEPPATSAGSPVLATVAACPEGRFWLLGTDAQAGISSTLGVLDEVDDAGFANIARALLLADLCLYDDALALIRCGADGSDRKVRTVLAHITQSMVYNHMERTIAGGGPVACAIPTRFAIWARRREQYHRKCASALQPGVVPSDTCEEVTLAAPLRSLPFR